ncbi:hypothetical protein LI90_2298 [Carbonactinospora thermoautotrophica]|uniref:Uncharacterized protein n=1 Tax=Carbonactinospora thermoautotrophica TaxID=1469144 RepID=A0A132MU77_9ACTN|nr:hypothetical protein LI90_2298 [Carbonactinospora thermoautotrophica]
MGGDASVTHGWTSSAPALGVGPRYRLSVAAGRGGSTRWQEVSQAIRTSQAFFAGSGVVADPIRSRVPSTAWP